MRVGAGAERRSLHSLAAGAGYQIAVAPTYRASPLTPAYNNNWVSTTRLNF
jgi:hypothetical protein